MVLGVPILKQFRIFKMCGYSYTFSAIFTREDNFCEEAFTKWVNSFT